MATAVIMPRQGQSVESCLFGEWKKAVGDPVEIGDVLFSYETDKATFEEEAKTAGILLATLCEPGDDIPCLDTVAVIGEQGEDISAFLNKKEADSSQAQNSPAPAGNACLRSHARTPIGRLFHNRYFSPRAGNRREDSRRSRRGRTHRAPRKDFGARYPDGAPHWLL